MLTLSSGIAWPEGEIQTEKTISPVLRTILVALPAKCTVNSIKGHAEMAVKFVDTEYTIVEVGNTVDPSNIINMYKDSKVVLVCTKDEEIIMQTKESGEFYTFEKRN